jgi:hypothetical protein
LGALFVPAHQLRAQLVQKYYRLVVPLPASDFQTAGNLMGVPLK